MTKMESLPITRKRLINPISGQKPGVEDIIVKWFVKKATNPQATYSVGFLFVKI